MRTLSTLLFPVFLIVGCADGNLPDYYDLSKSFRVLAIEMNGAQEISATSLPAMVSLTPVISDRAGAGRAVQVQVVSCPDPGVALGADPSCDGNPFATAPQSFTYTPGAGAAGEFRLPTSVGRVPAISVAVPALAIAGRSAIDLFNGVPYLVTFRWQAGSEVVRGFKRVVITSRTSLNSAPLLTDVQVAGVPLTTRPVGQTTLNSAVDPGAIETYQAQNRNGQTVTLQEEVSITWFVTDGELTRSRTFIDETTKWTPATTPPGAGSVLVAVIRDSRGALQTRIVEL